jgi:hypothetical protein
MSVIFVTHGKVESMSPTLRFPNVRREPLLGDDFTWNREPSGRYCCQGAKQSRGRNLKAACLFITLAMTLVWSARHSLGAEPDWYESPLGQARHLDLNKISLIRDSVIGPDMHTLQFYSFGSHFLLGVSAAGFSDQMLAQLESLLLPKSNWVRVPDRKVAMFVNLDYVVGYTSGPDGGYNLILTTGEDVVVSAKDNEANAKIKEFGFQ